MRRAFLAFLCVGLLAVAGSVLMAQTDYGSTDQPAADTSSTTSQADTSATPSGTTSDTSGQGQVTGTATETAGQPMDQDAQQQNLPATASNLPLVFAIGLSALGAAALLRVYRSRYAR